MATIKILELQQQTVVRYTVEEDTDFHGVIVLSKPVYDAMPPAAVEAMMLARYEEWRVARTPLAVDPASVTAVELQQIEEARSALTFREAQLRGEQST